MSELDTKKMMDTLDNIDKKTGKAFARKALRAGAKSQFASARAFAPELSGTTESALKIKATKRRVTKVGMMLTLSKRDFQNPKFYAPFVEYGHKTRGGKHVAGLHWMKGSFMGNLAVARQIVIETLSNLINQYKGEMTNDVEE